jgi:three-Cys-motif partner protein
MDRAVVFLDPYGMAVDWDTVVRIGHTRKVDLWMLFPCSGVIRMLPRKGEPDDAWAKRLTSLFGTEDWRAEFYPKSRQADLFANADARERRVDAESVAEFLIGRLNGIFSAVIERPVILYNSRGSPLFFLVFAAGNPRGAVTAVKIAQHLVVRS